MASRRKRGPVALAPRLKAGWVLSLFTVDLRVERQLLRTEPPHFTYTNPARKRPEETLMFS
jgi:hypothetical protein